MTGNWTVLHPENANGLAMVNHFEIQWEKISARRQLLHINEYKINTDVVELVDNLKKEFRCCTTDYPVDFHKSIFVFEELKINSKKKIVHFSQNHFILF